MTWRSSTTPADRFFACLPYLMPLISALVFGNFLFREFPALQIVFLPLAPVLALYGALPFANLIIFFALYLGVVRNEKISHFIRFNAMQAILLDIVLFLCQVLVQYVLLPALRGGLVVETIYNVIFLGAVAAILYSVVQSILGRYAEIPTLSDAVYMQVP